MYIFNGFKHRYSKEVEAVRYSNLKFISLNSRKQFPFVQPFELLENGKVLRLTYSEGIEMLRASGEEIDDYADMTYETFDVVDFDSTPQEKALGRLIKQKYKTDFCILWKLALLIDRCP